MIKKLSVIVALVISSGTISMATLSVRFDGRDLVVHDGKQNFRLEALLDKRAFFGTIHAYQQRRQDYYVVYGTSEWSHPWSPGNGSCGCGIESYIRWLHIKDGSILEQQEGKYESCLLNRDGWAIKWEDRKLIWSTEGSETKEGQVVPMAFRWIYDSANPALGIREHKTSIQKRRKEIKIQD